MMTVEQMINNNNNYATNQFVLRDRENGILAFQSYASRIATIDYPNRTITIGVDYDYSKTTNKHRNIFFNDYAVD